MSNRLNQERQQHLEPRRMQYAIDQLSEHDVHIIHMGEKSLKFLFKGHPVTFYPYSGWFTGKTVQDGRGIDNLLKQIQP